MNSIAQRRQSFHLCDAGVDDQHMRVCSPRTRRAGPRTGCIQSVLPRSAWRRARRLSCPTERVRRRVRERSPGLRGVVMREPLLTHVVVPAVFRRRDPDSNRRHHDQPRAEPDVRGHHGQARAPFRACNRVSHEAQPRRLRGTTNQHCHRDQETAGRARGSPANPPGTLSLQQRRSPVDAAAAAQRDRFRTQGATRPPSAANARANTKAGLAPRDPRDLVFASGSCQALAKGMQRRAVRSQSTR